MTKTKIFPQRCITTARRRLYNLLWWPRQTTLRLRPRHTKKPAVPTQDCLDARHCLEVIISLIRARVAIHIAHNRHCRVLWTERASMRYDRYSLAYTMIDSMRITWRRRFSCVKINTSAARNASRKPFRPTHRRRMPVSARGRCTCALFIGINGVQITRPSALLVSLVADLKTNLRTLISLMSSFTGRYRVAY